MRAPEPFTTRAPGGVCIACDRLGDPAARAVVFLHGGGQTRRSWGKAAAAVAFAPEVRSGIKVPDPGFGSLQDNLLAKALQVHFGQQQDHRPICRKLPTAGSVKSAVPASQIHIETLVESSWAPSMRS